MSSIEAIEEITLALLRCKRNCGDCETCKDVQACLEVFSKEIIIEEIENLASQCKAFNEFARANQKGDE